MASRKMLAVQIPELLAEYDTIDAETI